MNTKILNINGEKTEENSHKVFCDKKCKSNRNLSQNTTKNCFFDKNSTQNMLETAKKTGLVTYIKVLLEIYKSLPNIVGIIDRIIENRATTLVPSSSIYGDSYLQTLNQIDKVINLTERKDKLLNLYVIIEKILESLNAEDRKIAVLKFIQKDTGENIAKEIKSTERTVFRKANKILEKIAIFMLEQNWTVDFLKHQIGNESWIDDIYNQKAKEELINKNKVKKL